VRLTLLYISSDVVIPAKAGIQKGKTGFRVKPGMTIKGKGFMTHYTRMRVMIEERAGGERGGVDIPFSPC
jgi:hypothetical protein